MKHTTGHTISMSIARRLIVYTILYSSSITLLLSSFQLYRSYQNALSEIHAQLDEIEKVHLEVLSENLWSVDLEGVSAFVKGMSNLEGIQYIAVRDTTQIVAEYRTKKTRETLFRTFDIVYKKNKVPQKIGQLEVKISLSKAYQIVTDQALNILFGNGIKTILVVLFMSIIFYQFVFKHLVVISEYIRFINLEIDQSPLKLEREESATYEGDELGILVNSINKMVIDLQSGIRRHQLSEHKLLTLIDTIPDFIWLRDINGIFLFCNYKVEQLFGVKKSKIIGKTIYEFSANRHPFFSTPNDTMVLSTKQSHLSELKLSSSLGCNEEIYEVVHTPMLSPEGIAIGVLGVARDITERKDHEKQLRHASKMEAIGQLAGGVSHDFNNILAIVLGNLDILEDMFREDTTALSRINRAQKGANRGVEIAAKLLNFSGGENINPRIISINSLIENFEDLISTSLTASITIEFQLADNLWETKVNSGDFEDTLLNLVLNARDSMPNGGRIYIETMNKTLDTNYVSRNPEAQFGDFIVISIRDTGFGMSKETVQKALEPFFSTKKQRGGTGLGLSMVVGFVKRSGGHIKIHSRPGEGTTFNIYLPRTKNHGFGSVIDVKPNLNPPPIGTETVLVVDDEEYLRELTVSNLTELGYKTLSAENGQKALEILHKVKSIDLLLSDVVMPGGIDGFVLAIKAIEKHPSLKILLTSGYTEKQARNSYTGDNFMLELIDNILSKPYSKYDLAVSIRATLDKR